MEKKKTIFSGIKPTGDLNIGHYLGVIKPWTELQNEFDCLFCIVNLHALTIPENVKGVLQKQTYELLALYIAMGLDPKKSHIFLQSDNPDHTYLYWILECFTPFGQMKRMTQFKDKSEELKERISGGLFDYPVLMASDILLYDTDFVPVGQDQKQHVELARDIVLGFNKMYKVNTLKMPIPMIPKFGAKIMDLQNPLKKMSKSAKEDKGIIFVLDSLELIEKKISKAVTDSDGKIKFDLIKKPAISNLIQIYMGFSGLGVKEIEEKYSSLTYVEFKKDLINLVWETLEPIQLKFKEILKDTKYINSVLEEGLRYALSLSNKKVEEVKKVIGLNKLN